MLVKQRHSYKQKHQKRLRGLLAAQVLKYTPLSPFSPFLEPMIVVGELPLPELVVALAVDTYLVKLVIGLIVLASPLYPPPLLRIVVAGLAIAAGYFLWGKRHPFFVELPADPAD
ncbi:MAG: hypothetical protein IPP67_00180 [Rhodospirillaceae bacterium]|nr:hypothetical protein [Rhodospirillaceae bacterium]